MTRALRGGLLAACAILIVVQSLAAPVAASGPHGGAPAEGGAVTDAATAAVDSSGLDAEAEKKQTIQTSSKSLSNGKLTLTGRVQYQSNDGSGLKPARQVTVEVRAVGGVRNEMIAKTTTDDSGRYSVTINVEEEEVDYDLDKKLKVRVIAYAVNPAARVHDAKTKWPWDGELAGVSTTQTWKVGQQSATANFEATSQRHRRYFQIADWMLDGYRFTRSEASWTRRTINVRYFPEQSAHFQFQAPLDRIVISDFEDWESYDMKGVILHEYGHAVMDGLYGYGGWQIPEYKKGDHCSHSETGQYYAFNEGFAKFFSAAVAGDPDARGDGLETKQWYDTSDTYRANDDCPTGDIDGTYDGAKVEGAVGAVLWDAYDPANEPHDDIDGSLTNVFAAISERDNPNLGRVFNGGRTSDLHDFFLQYVEKTDRQEELRRIYFEYGIVKPDRFDAPPESADDGLGQCLVHRYPCSRMAAEDPARIDANTTVHAGLHRNDDDEYVIGIDANQRVNVTLVRTNGDANLDLAIYSGRPPVGGPGSSAIGGPTRHGDALTQTFSPDQSGTFTVKIDDAGSAHQLATYKLQIDSGATSSFVLPDDGLGQNYTLDPDVVDDPTTDFTYCDVYPEDCTDEGSSNGTDDSESSTSGSSDGDSDGEDGPRDDSEGEAANASDGDGASDDAEGDKVSDDAESDDSDSDAEVAADSDDDGGDAKRSATTAESGAEDTRNKTDSPADGTVGFGPGFGALAALAAVLCLGGALAWSRLT